jgi:Tfp pilus assembly PilM family ATPase
MGKAKKTTVGIEYDTLGIRAAKVTASKRGKYIHYNIDKLEEIRGSFEKEEDLTEGLKKIRGKISIGLKERIVTCVSGKQLYAVQIPFKTLPEAEMENALKFEIRKNLPFEATGSTLDYQVIKRAEKKDENSTLLVTTVANVLLDNHLAALHKVGIKPHAVDVLPVAVSNVFWREKVQKVEGEAFVMIHLSPTVCNMVVDGNEVMFYTRSIYFSSQDIFGEHTEEEVAGKERERRMNAFGEELKRSLAFYEKNYGTSNYSACYLMGEYVDIPDVFEFFKEKIRLDLKYSELTGIAESKKNARKGKFDVAIGLAMR